MKKVKIKIDCPYEIGDVVQFKTNGSIKRMEVTDVIMTLRTKDNSIKFTLELEGWYMLDTNRHKVAITQKGAGE